MRRHFTEQISAPGSFQPGVVAPRRVSGAGHHRGPRLAKPLLEAGEGEDEALRGLLPVSAVEDDDEVAAAVLGQTVRRLSALVHSRDVAGRTGTWILQYLASDYVTRVHL